MTTLPPFNIFVRFVSEIPIGSESRTTPNLLSTNPVNIMGTDYDSNLYKDKTTTTVKYKQGAFELVDVEILGEGIVTSVNDMVTEIQYQFVAKDFKEYTLSDDDLESIQKKEELRFEFEKKRAGGFDLGQDWEEKIKQTDGYVFESGDTMNVLASAFPDAMAKFKFDLMSEELQGIERVFVPTLDYQGLGPGEGEALIREVFGENVDANIAETLLENATPSNNSFNPLRRGFNSIDSLLAGNTGSTAPQPITSKHPLHGMKDQLGNSFVSFQMNVDQQTGAISVTGRTESGMGHQVPLNITVGEYYKAVESGETDPIDWDAIYNNLDGK
jgi:hypothetical protein